MAPNFLLLLLTSLDPLYSKMLKVMKKLNYFIELYVKTAHIQIHSLICKISGIRTVSPRQ